MKARLLWLGLALAGPVLAADALTREQIDQARESIELRHAQQEKACREQFIVTPCLEAARVERQQGLQKLRAQELELDAAERQQRTLAQERRVHAKAQAAAQRQRQARVHPPSSHSLAQPPQPSSAPRSASMALPADRSNEEQRKRDQFEARQRAIEAHRAAVDKRNAERAKQHPPTHLPMPASAASR